MQYAVDGQLLWLKAFDASGYVEDDQAQITCALVIDGASPIALGNPTQATQKKGNYYYTLTAAQTTGHSLKPIAQSSSGGVQVVGTPDTIYTTREAAIKAKTDLIGTGSATISSPVASSGQIFGPLIIGDDYLAANDRALQWTVATPTGVTVGVATCQLGFLLGTNTLQVDGTLTDAGGGNSLLSFDLTRAQTETLPAGFYSWSVQITSDDAKEITKVKSSSAKVQWAEKYTA